MASRTDYIVLAEALREVKPASAGMLSSQWRTDCIAIGMALSSKTKAFDMALFLRNCGVNDGNY